MHIYNIIRSKNCSNSSNFKCHHKENNHRFYNLPGLKITKKFSQKIISYNNRKKYSELHQLLSFLGRSFLRNYNWIFSVSYRYVEFILATSKVNDGIKGVLIWCFLTAGLLRGVILCQNSWEIRDFLRVPQNLMFTY